MKTLFLFLSINFLFTIVSSAKIIHVKHDASGENNGTSWNDAYTSLNEAISATVSGDTIWVARGVYTPENFTSFKILPGRVYMGNFQGTETHLNQRDVTDVSAHTILDGNNSTRHILTRDNQNLGPAHEAIIDGFTIQRGRAIPDADNNPGSSTGSAALIRGGFVTFKNCTITNNYAKAGGAISLYGFFNASTLYVENTRIRFFDCTFSKNQGAALSNINGLAVKADLGAASGYLGAEFIFDRCKFDDERYYENVAFPGSLVFLQSSRSSFNNCTFNRNFFTPLDLMGGETNIDSCTFYENLGYSTSCFNLNIDKGTISNCTFRNGINTVKTSFLAGPSVGYLNGSIVINNCIFDNNTSFGTYGALLIQGMDRTIMNNCSFTNNQTKIKQGNGLVSLYGGAVTVSNNSSLKANNCLFFNNSLDVNPEYSSPKYGGAIYAAGAADVHILQCTFVKNVATAGAAIYANYSADTNAVTITNSILWDNQVMIDTNLNTGNISYALVPNSVQREGNKPSRIIINSSLYQTGKCGWNAYCEPTEINDCLINVDPLFLDTTTYDFRLRSCSPAIDAGNKDSIISLLNDYSGNLRLQGLSSDLGIYENPVLISDMILNSELAAPLVLSPSDFTDKFNDLTGPLENIRIVSLPEEGSLLFNGKSLQVPFFVNVADISKLHFEADSCIGSQVKFKWVGMSGDTCALHDTAQVIINTGGGVYVRPEKPIVSYSSAIEFCAGDSVKLKAPTGFQKYLWSDGQTSESIIVKASGNYFVKVYDICYSYASDTVFTIRKTIPTPLISDGSRCLPGPATITVSGADNFFWYTDSTSATPIATGASYSYEYLTTNDTIYLESEIAGCFSPRQSIVTYIDSIVPPKPIVQDTGRCEGTPITLSIDNFSNDFLYRWYIVRNSGIAGAGFSYETPVKTFPANSLQQDSIVLVRAEGYACISEIDTVKVKVFLKPEKPEITYNESLTTCDSLELFAPSGYKQYQWIHFDENSPFNIVSTQNRIYAKQTLEIVLIVTSYEECISPASDPVAITISSVPVPLLQQDGDSLRASSGSDSYKWYLNGLPLTLNGPAIYPEQSGAYSVQGEDINGCVSDTSDAIMYVVTSITQDKLIGNNFVIYPNPVKDLVYIASPMKENLSVKIVNSQGILMKEEKLNTNNFIDISSFPEGLYFVKISNEEFSEVVKVMKK
ncbi:MAG TPA: T9SS type A sorting domain-containing protein [Cytophagaceae bacterium]